MSLVFDPVGHAHFFEELWQDGGGEVRLALIQIAGEDFHRQHAAPLQFGQRRQEGIAVFAAGQADEPFCTPFHHAVLFHRFAGLADDAFAQFFVFGSGRGTVKERMDICGCIEHEAVARTFGAGWQMVCQGWVTVVEAVWVKVRRSM